jgi:hypothetical protein
MASSVARFCASSARARWGEPVTLWAARGSLQTVRAAGLSGPKPTLSSQSPGGVAILARWSGAWPWRWPRGTTRAWRESWMRGEQCSPSRAATEGPPGRRAACRQRRSVVHQEPWALLLRAACGRMAVVVTARVTRLVAPPHGADPVGLLAAAPAVVAVAGGVYSPQDSSTNPCVIRQHDPTHVAGRNAGVHVGRGPVARSGPSAVRHSTSSAALSRHRRR